MDIVTARVTHADVFCVGGVRSNLGRASMTEDRVEEEDCEKDWSENHGKDLLLMVQVDTASLMGCPYLSV
jgi:hypothetical protein